jgi:hypothetical protein
MTRGEIIDLTPPQIQARLAEWGEEEAARLKAARGERQ